MSGRVLDENGRPVPDTLVEIWQANAAGRYPHRDRPAQRADRSELLRRRPHRSPTRTAATVSSPSGPANIPGATTTTPGGRRTSTSRSSGQAFLHALVTQMYFPGDPLLAYDPMFTCIADEAARNRLVSVFDWETTIPEQALGYRFDIVLRGRDETPMEKMP